MAATSLKLPEGLKRRIERLAASARKSPHAFMVETLAREAERAELRSFIPEQPSLGPVDSSAVCMRP